MQKSKGKLGRILSVLLAISLAFVLPATISAFADPDSGAKEETLTVTSPLEIQLGTVWNRATAMQGVVALDREKNDISNQVAYPMSSISKPIDTSTPGIYILDYQIRYHGNLTSVPRVIIVNDGRYTVGANLILEAYPFTIQSTDVPTNTAQIEDHLIAKTRAKAYDAKTGIELSSSLLSVSHTGGYSATTGEYNVVIAAKDKGATTEHITKTVKAKVTSDVNNAPVITPQRPVVVPCAENGGPLTDAQMRGDTRATDIEDGDLTVDIAVIGGPIAAGEPGVYPVMYSVTDRAGITSTARGVVVVDDGRYVVGEGRILEAYSFEIASADVPSNVSEIPAHLFAQTQAKVYDSETGAVLSDSLLSVLSTGGYSGVASEYDVVIMARGNTLPGYIVKTVNAKVVAAVVENRAPVIKPQRPIVVPCSADGGLLTDAQMKGSTTATDLEDGDLTDVITVIGDPIYANVPGAYPIIFTVTDKEGRATQAKSVVVVADEAFKYGETYVLLAKDFTLDSLEVDNEAKAAQILAKSFAVAWDFEGAQTEVFVSDIGGYQDAAGTYYPRISVVSEPSLSSTITVVVTATPLDPPPDPPKRWRVTFDANEGYLTGPSEIYVLEPNTTLGYLPSTPLRPGYDFLFWGTSPSGGVRLMPDTVIDNNIMVYAQWEPVSVSPPTTVTPMTTLPPASTYVPAITPSTQEVTQDTEQPETTAVEEEKTPLAEPDPPLTEPEPDTTASDPVTPEELTWALMNVIGPIASVFLFLLSMVKFFYDRSRKNERYTEEPVSPEELAAMTPERRAIFLACREENHASWLDEQRQKENKAKMLHVNGPVLLISGAAIIESLIVLFASSNFGGGMALTDGFSFGIFLVLIIQLVAPIIAAVIRNRNPKMEEDDETYASESNSVASWS